MKGFVHSIPKAIVKLVAMLLSPILRLFTWVYQIAILIASYALIGLSLLTLLAAGVEVVFVGMTKEAGAYLAIAVLAFALRWLLIQTLPLLQKLQEVVRNRAAAPINSNRYDPMNNYSVTYYSYL